jgi:thiosulfate/3-mercaptopyruvate sulfurtransferase
MISFSILALLLIPGADANDAKSYARPELLIDPAQLAELNATKDVRILDARGHGKYLEAHVPGAVWVDAVTWARAFATHQDQDKWVKLIGELGIDLDKPVVIYDDASAKDAARMWWILKYWGIRDVKLLNGGWTSWKDANGLIKRDEVKAKTTSPNLKAEKDRLATKNQLLDNIKKKALQIVDARSSDEFCGKQETAKRNGAIPGAVHQEWSEAIDKKSQRFKSADELVKLFKTNQIDIDRPTVTYCQSGGRAAVLAFTLELMGVKDVKNYYKSWSEWGNAEDTPIYLKPPILFLGRVDRVFTGLSLAM